VKVDPEVARLVRLMREEINAEQAMNDCAEDDPAFSLKLKDHARHVHLQRVRVMDEVTRRLEEAVTLSADLERERRERAELEADITSLAGWRARRRLADGR
jgi:hypothetical protein